MKALKKDFFDRDTETVARSLLGKRLVYKTKTGYLSGFITETEAYDGFSDKASHAFRGKTERNKVMFDSPGLWYPYLVYGMHWMLNITTREEGYPAAVLIRSIKMEEGTITGPGRVSKFFQVDKSIYGKPAVPATGLWIKESRMHPERIKISARVGVDYAGPYWAGRKLRFIATNLEQTET